MTLPPVIRIFFAINLSEGIKSELGNYINLLKKQAKTNGIRWTRSENLHITLQFLAQIETHHLQNLIQNVKDQIKFCTPIFFELAGVSLFPTPYRPRVIVCNLSPQTGLIDLATRIGKGTQMTQYEIENRPYRGHLTLGRIKQPQASHYEFLTKVPLTKLDPIQVQEICLFRSEPQPEGSHYVILETLPLCVPSLETRPADAPRDERL